MAQLFNREPLVCAVILSIAPDSDFLSGLLVGEPALYHQGINRSLSFAFVLA